MTPESTSSAPLPADKHCRSREPSRSSCVTGDVCFGKARGASHRGERRRHTRKIRGVRLALYLTCSWGSYQSLHAQNGNMRIENHKSSFLKERKKESMRNVTPPVAFSAGKRLVFCGGILGATSLITNSIKKKKKTLIPQLKSLHDILVLRRINRKREGQPSRLMSRGRSPSYCVTFKGSRVMQKSRLSRRRGDEERRGGGAAQKPLTEN